MIRKRATSATRARAAGGRPSDDGAASGKRGTAASDPTLARVRALAQIATEFDLAEINLEAGGGVRVVRRASGGSGGGYAAPAAAPSLPHPPALSMVPAAPVDADDSALFVSSPFVGTFYRAPSPEASAFVEVGQSVRKGQVVCIIEAMKLMNEIESEADGKVAEVLVKNGEHVEYGQKLFRLTKA